MSHRKHQGKALTPDAKTNWRAGVDSPPPAEHAAAAVHLGEDEATRAADNTAGAAQKPKPTVKRRRPRIPADRKMAVKGASERVAARSRKEAFK
jgi:hypothetical protein